MARILALITMAVTGIASAYAASVGINPGDVLNADGSVSVGLLANSGTKSGLGITASAGTTPSVDGLTGTRFTQANYYSQAGVLNSGATSNALPETSTSWATNTCAQTGTTGNCQNTIFTPTGGPTFNLLGDNLAADKNIASQAWISTAAGSASPGTLNIPVGIFGVTSISTLLNTTGGVTTGGTAVCSNGALVSATGCTANAAAYATITFQFNATDATGATGTNLFETLALINGVTQRNVMSGLGSYASTISSSYATTDTIGNSYTVTTGLAYSSPIGTAGTSNSPPTTATMVLDYQIFPVLTAYQSDYLVQVSINNYGTAATTASTFSQELLSGLTVSTASSVSTPEPSTILLTLTAGIIWLAVPRLRRRRN